MEVREFSSEEGSGILADGTFEDDSQLEFGWDEAQIAWQMMGSEWRSRRWVETLELKDLFISGQTIEIDFSLPPDIDEDVVLVPAAHFMKDHVASDLRTYDEAGSSVTALNKRENMAITFRSLELLHDGGQIDLDERPFLRGLARQIVFGNPFEANAARRILEENVSSTNDHLVTLLRRLEFRFLLWIPVDATDGKDRQVTVRRTQAFAGKEVVVKQKPVTRDLHIYTAAGEAKVTFESGIGRRYVDWGVFLSKLWLGFGMTPVDVGSDSIDAVRFESAHLRLEAPRGFLVRDLVLEPAIRESKAFEPITEESEEPGVLVQGSGSDVGHFHLTAKSNPEVWANASFGLKDGVTTLWAGAAIFTALLLWMVLNLAPAGFEKEDSGQLEVVAAALLLGPALSAAWVSRTYSGILGRSVIGTQMALLASAGVAVGSALALAGVEILGLGLKENLELYAGSAYLIACLVIVGWLAANPLARFLHRTVWNTSARALIWLGAGSALVGAIAIHPDLPEEFVALSLLFLGLSIGAIAIRPRSPRSVRRTRIYPYVGAFSAFATLLGAGYYLGFYRDAFSEDLVWPVLTAVAATSAVVSFASIRWSKQSGPI